MQGLEIGRSAGGLGLRRGVLLPAAVVFGLIGFSGEPGAQTTAAPVAEASTPSTGVAAPAPPSVPTVGTPASPTAGANSGTVVEAIAAMDLTPWGMFLSAGEVVKAVMISLVLASVTTWTVWFAKTLQLALVRRRLRSSLRALRAAANLAAAVRASAAFGGPAAAMLAEATDELRASEAALAYAGGDRLERRVAIALGRIEVAAMRRLTAGVAVVATIGSVAPFVGLFGTVWGIMSAFVGISKSQTTTLSVVAPGIAEALFATALGLVAAIPAVVLCNLLNRALGERRRLLGDCAAQIERLIGRDLDFRAVPHAVAHGSVRDVAAE